MFKTGASWNDFQETMKQLTDRSLKLMLAKEAFASGNMNAAYWFLSELGAMKGRDVAELVEAYLQAHLDGEEAAVASNTLAVIGDPASIAPLTEALRSKDENVQLAAAVALKQLGYRAPADQMIATFAKQLESPDGGMRRRAVERITDLDAVAGVPVFTRALKDTNGDVRNAALTGLLSSGIIENPQFVEPFLNDPYPEVARQARDIVDMFKRGEK
jgi:HEAT repeat protein